MNREVETESIVREVAIARNARGAEIARIDPDRETRNVVRDRQRVAKNLGERERSGQGVRTGEIGLIREIGGTGRGIEAKTEAARNTENNLRKVSEFGYWARSSGRYMKSDKALNLVRGSHCRILFGSQHTELQEGHFLIFSMSSRKKF